LSDFINLSLIIIDLTILFNNIYIIININEKFIKKVLGFKKK
jgi:hypothetical protein